MTFEQLKEKYPRHLSRAEYHAGPIYLEVVARFVQEADAIVPEDGTLGLESVELRNDELFIDFEPQEIDDDTRIKLDLLEYVTFWRSTRLCNICGRPGELRNPSHSSKCDNHSNGEKVRQQNHGFRYIGPEFVTYDPATDGLVEISADELLDAGERLPIDWWENFATPEQRAEMAA